jgi:hypothetical protein
MSAGRVTDLVARCVGDACLAGLVRAIDDLLQPQAYLCSMGADWRLHGDEIMRMTERGVSR